MNGDGGSWGAEHRHKDVAGRRKGVDRDRNGRWRHGVLCRGGSKNSSCGYGGNGGSSVARGRPRRYGPAAAALRRSTGALAVIGGAEAQRPMQPSPRLGYPRLGLARAATSGGSREGARRPQLVAGDWAGAATTGRDSGGAGQAASAKTAIAALAGAKPAVTTCRRHGAAGEGRGRGRGSSGGGRGSATVAEGRGNADPRSIARTSTAAAATRARRRAGGVRRRLRRPGWSQVVEALFRGKSGSREIDPSSLGQEQEGEEEEEKKKRGRETLSKLTAGRGRSAMAATHRE